MKKYTCFVISPIGEEGSEVYQEYKDLLDLIIEPALEVFDIDVSRGDHHISESQIDLSVIAKIQNSDICICDISMPNPNVYYELGRRDETGKPLILLKRKGSAPSPVDIATRRFIEYDYDGRYAIRDAQNHIRDMVAPLIEQGFERTGRGATLGDIAATLARIERQLKDLQKNGVSAGGGGSVSTGDTGGELPGDPIDVLKYAIRQKDVPLAERAMIKLQYTSEPTYFYDQIVQSVMGIGSVKAGQMLFDYAETFIYDSSISFQKKVEYLGYLVSHAGRQNTEEEVKELIEALCENLLSEARTTDPDPALVARVHNQKNRLYYGIYVNTKEPEWLGMAISSLRQALELQPTNFIYFNLASCYWAYAKLTGEDQYYQLAKESIEGCLRLEKNDDDDHLALACRIYHHFGDYRFEEVFERLEAIAPIVAANLKYELGA